MPKQKQRFAYMVMIWQERAASPDDPAVWRISVEDARTGERHGFACLEAMTTFLQDRTGAGETAPPEPPKRRA